jgi:hypothetical protein
MDRTVLFAFHCIPAEFVNRNRLESGGKPGPRGSARSGDHDSAAMISAARERHPGSPVRVTLASRLGHDIDGAWWPRTARMARELPELIAVLGTRLGEITHVGVN